MLGGGGYTIRNVSRCWAYETSILAQRPLSNDLPVTLFHSQFAPEHKLHQAVHLESDFASILSTAGAAGPNAIAGAAGLSAFAPESGLNAPHYSSNAFYSSGDSPDNFNTRQYLDAIKTTVLERLRRLQGAPSVACTIVPRASDFEEEATDPATLKRLQQTAKQRLWK